MSEATAVCKCWGLKKCLCVHVWKLPHNPLAWENVPVTNCNVPVASDFPRSVWASSSAGPAAEWVMPLWELLSRCAQGKPQPAPQLLALLTALAGWPSSVPLLFGPSLALARLGASSISWEVVFGLGMIHPVKTSLGEGCLTASLRSL